MKESSIHFKKHRIRDRVIKYLHQRNVKEKDKEREEMELKKVDKKKKTQLPNTSTGKLQ